MSDVLLFSLPMAMVKAKNFSPRWEMFVCIRTIPSSLSAIDASDADAVKAVLSGQYCRLPVVAFFNSYL